MGGETNTVTVTTADVLCTNGVVHIVNAVLIPNSLRTIVDLAVGTPELSSLVGALQTANLVNALSGPGPFTVFAPTNDAFAAISSVVDGLTVDQLTKVLENHVISGVSAKAADLSNGQVLSSLFHESTVSIHRENYGGLQIEAEAATVRVTVRDQVCNNGVVHIVNAVLLPRYQTIVEAAFAAIASLGLSTKQLKDVLLYHVLNEEFKSTDLTNGGVLLPLFTGHGLTVDLTNGVKIMAEENSVMVTTADVACTNGVVHIVDAVLIPNRLAVSEVV